MSDKEFTGTRCVPGQRVRHIDDPAKVGTVSNQGRQRPAGRQVRVDWGGRLDWHFEGELIAADVAVEDVYDLVRDGRYGRIEGLRQVLTHVHLSGRLANVIYAMGLTQTDFYPHQYKPLLTLLDSPANGLLIADEVGLGKTIEAGLIWTELRARYSDTRRLLVVCPAMLREKWHMELSRRFGLDPRIVSAEDLVREVETAGNSERAWIASYQGIRIPGDWEPSAERRKPGSGRAQLADLLYSHADQDPLFDLVIFDEAHYMRNDERASWKTGNLLRDLSAHQVMLSATPINLASRDLFNVLRLLDPDHFGLPDDFHNILEANKPVVAASDIVRDPRSDPVRILEAIGGIRESRYFENSDRVRLLIEEAAAITEWTEQRRIEIAARIERLNLLAHIITRTRKRDVPSERVVRQAQLSEAEMSPLERRLYEAITEGTREYAEHKGIGHGFLLGTPQRMVASCPAALLRSWREETVDADGMAVASDESDHDDDTLLEYDRGLRHFLSVKVLPAFDADELARVDSKFTQFLTNVRRFLAEDPSEKAIVFTTFRGTARYLRERLTTEGIKSELIMGGLDFDKEAVVDAFRDDPTYRILVCTDVAAEGVDLQFCRLVVNYDLPWNPMRIEQRIGRIDRIGQLAKKILVWNFVHKDTIDARIAGRLSERIGVFESTLGGTGEILGEVRRLEDTLLSRHLTPEQEARLIEDAALAIENVRQRQEQLEQEAVQLVAHGQQLLTQIELARGDDRIITSDDLMQYVEGYIRNVPGCRVVPVRGEPNTFDIGLSSSLAADLDEFLRRENLLGKTGLASGQVRRCRFTDKITQKPSSNLEVVHRFHPIIRFVSERSKHDGDDYRLYAGRVSGPSAQMGSYVLAATLASCSGVKEEEHLLIAGYALNSGVRIDEREAESLLGAARRLGTDWPAVAADVSAENVKSALAECEAALESRYRELRDTKRREDRDRTDVLLQLLRDHVIKKRDGFDQRIRNHEFAAEVYGNSVDARRRKGLANAERKKRADFLARMEMREASLIQKSAKFSADRREVCVLLLDVVPES